MKSKFNVGLVTSSLCMICFLLPALVCAQEEQSLPFADKMLGALFNKDFQRNLELVESQSAELKKVLKEVEDKRNSLGKEMKEYQQSGATKEEISVRHKEIVADFEKQKADFQIKATAVLLPHLLDRLKQLTVQFMMKDTAKRNRIPTGILAPEIRSYLDIDDSQAEKIEKRATEIRDELRKKIQELTKKAQDDLLAELSDSQKKKYKKLVGDIVQ